MPYLKEIVRTTLLIAQSMTITGVIPSWIPEIICSYKGNGKVQSIIQQLNIQQGFVPHFTFQKNVLRYKGLIYIGSQTDFRKTLFSVFHESIWRKFWGFKLLIRNCEHILYRILSLEVLRFG